MPYYGAAGDYYGQAGGIGGFLKGVGKAALGFVTGGPVAAVTAVLPKVQPTQLSSGLMLPSAAPTLSGPGAAPGGGAPRGYHWSAKAGRFVRNRRMNPANSRALTRANRRIEGFVRLTKRSLKHTNYKLVTKSSGRGRGRRGLSVRESGPGSVVVN